MNPAEVSHFFGCHDAMDYPETGTCAACKERANSYIAFNVGEHLPTYMPDFDNL